MNKTITLIPLDKLKISKRNTRPRPKPSDPDIRALAISISEIGLLDPLIVRSIGDFDEYELVAGARRLTALKYLKRDTAPCQLLELNDAEFMRRLIANNMMRKDASPILEASGMKDIYMSLPEEMTEKDKWDRIAGTFGQTRSWVRGRAQLVHLDPLFTKAMTADETPGQQKIAGYLRSLPIDTLSVIARQDGKVQRIFFESLESSRYNSATWPHSREDMEEDLEGDPKQMLVHQMPWDLTDDVLLPAAGACMSCPKRCSQDPDLFGFADEVTDKEDRCVDPKCFGQKHHAHAILLVGVAKAKNPSLKCQGHRGATLLGLPEDSTWHNNQAKKKDPGSFGIITNVNVNNEEDPPTLFIQGKRLKIEYVVSRKAKDVKKEALKDTTPKEAEKVKKGERVERLTGRRNKALLELVQRELEKIRSKGASDLSLSSDDAVCLIAEFGYDKRDQHTYADSYTNWTGHGGAVKSKDQTTTSIHQWALRAAESRLDAKTGDQANEMVKKLPEILAYWNIDVTPMIEAACEAVKAPAIMGTIKPLSHIWTPKK